MENYLQYLNESPTVFFKYGENYGKNLEFVTSNVKDIFGYTSEDFMTNKIDFLNCVYESDKEQLKEEVTFLFNSNLEKYEFKPYRIQSKNKKLLLIQDITKVIRNNTGEITHFFSYLRDITSQKISENIQKQKELDRYMKIINENVLVSSTDLEGKIISYSDKFKKVSGFTDKELIGNRHNIMKHEDNEENMYKDLWETIIKGKVWKGEHKNISKDGKIFWVENIVTPNFDDNKVIESYTSVYTDITLRKNIAELLITDALTNLYNRRHFNTIFKTELKRSRRHQYNFVLMMIDIDYFKQYNDTYGHPQGDIALVRVANSLQNSIHRPEDYVFRLGGEEFCVITSNIDNDGIFQLANKLKNNIENLYIEHNKNSSSDYLTVSIGIKTIEYTNILDYEEIYKLADDALYKAKKAGRNRINLQS